jgi:hypothetical protein
MEPVAESSALAGAVVDVEVTGIGTVTVSGIWGRVVDGEDVVAVETPQPATNISGNAAEANQARSRTGERLRHVIETRPALFARLAGGQE